MEDYYVVYDATPLETPPNNWVQLGIARSVDQFDFEEGATENVDGEVVIDNPIPEDAIPEGSAGDEQKNNNMVILLAIISVIGVTAGVVCCIKKRGDKTDETAAFDSKDRMDSGMSDVSIETPFNNASIQ